MLVEHQLWEVYIWNLVEKDWSNISIMELLGKLLMSLYFCQGLPFESLVLLYLWSSVWGPAACQKILSFAVHLCDLSVLEHSRKQDR